YCWAIGIPVLHVGRFPAAARKMDALAMRHEGRPAIVLRRNTQFHAWLLFHLAHELGHICKGHVGPEGVVVDEKVDMDDCFLREEWEANQFAVELLTGGDNCAFEFPLRTTGVRLAELARTVGETNA